MHLYNHLGWHKAVMVVVKRVGGKDRAGQGGKSQGALSRQLSYDNTKSWQDAVRGHAVSSEKGV